MHWDPVLVEFTIYISGVMIYTYWLKQATNPGLFLVPSSLSPSINSPILVVVLSGFPLTSCPLLPSILPGVQHRDGAFGDDATHDDGFPEGTGARLTQWDQDPWGGSEGQLL